MRHVVHAQQVEAGEQAAEHGARGVAPVEEAEPRHALRRGLDPARHGRQRGAHEQGRRQQADRRGQAAHQHAHDTGAGPRRVEASNERHREQHEEADHADAELEPRVDTQRMRARRQHARQQQAAEAHAAHERAEQHADRDGRRPDDQFQELEPDDFVDERGAPAADKQQQKRREQARRLHDSPRRVKDYACLSRRPGMRKRRRLIGETARSRACRPPGRGVRAVFNTMASIV